MPRRAERKLSKRTVDALAADGRDAVFWDRDLPGFGIRVYPSGRKVYLVQARGPKGSKRATLGRHGEDLAPEQARKKAALAIDRIKRGEDPLPAKPKTEPTLADLAAHYMRAHVEVNCQPATVKDYRRCLDLHILPALGEVTLSSVERKHAADLHYRLRDTPTRANAALKILSHMFALGPGWGFETGGRNPCRFVRGYRERKRERFLTRDEYRRLGDVLDEAEKGRMSVYTVAAIRVLMLTGCRRNEVLELTWDDVDRTTGELRIRQAKTGPRQVPLTPAVAGILDALPRVKGRPWVFPGRGADGRLVSINAQWQALCARAGLEDVRIHDLRHSYASRALALGESLTVIGGLLGHTKVRTTARYAHLARDTEIEASAKIGASIGAHVLQDGTGPA